MTGGVGFDGRVVALTGLPLGGAAVAADPGLLAVTSADLRGFGGGCDGAMWLVGGWCGGVTMAELR